MSTRRKRKTVHVPNTRASDELGSGSVVEIVSQVEQALTPGFVAAGRGKEVESIIRYLKDIARALADGSLDRQTFKHEFNAKWSTLDDIAAAVFTDAHTVSMMEGVRQEVRKVRHAIRKTQREDPNLELELNKMVALFEDGSVRRLAAAGNAILAEMRNDASLGEVSSRLQAAVEELWQIQTLVSCRRRFESVKAQMKQQLGEALGRTRRRGATVSHTRSQLQVSQAITTDLKRRSRELVTLSVAHYEDVPVHVDPRLEELREKNAKLREEVGNAKTAVAMAEEKLVRLQRSIAKERLSLRNRRGEEAAQRHVTQFESLKSQLVMMQREFNEQLTREEKKRGELECLREQIQKRDQSLLAIINELNSDAQRAKDLIEMQSAFKTDGVARECAEVIEETKSEIEAMRAKDITRFENHIVKLLEAEQAKLSTCEKKRDAIKEDLDDAKEARHIRIEKLQQTLQELTLASNAVSLAEETAARFALEIARCQKQQHTVETQQAKKGKQLSRLQAKKPRTSGVVLITSLEEIQTKTTQYFPSIGQLMNEYYETVEKYKSLSERRARLLNSNDLLFHAIIPSEQWERLTDARESQNQFIQTSLRSLIQMELAEGRVPIDDETLPTKLSRLDRDATQAFTTAYANPQFAKYDTLKRELQSLQKQNKELTASITSLLADLDS